MLTIYGLPLSSPTNKVRYVANYLNLSYTFQLINLREGEHQQPTFLKLNPLGRIPAINDDGFMLAESNAIIRYLADKQVSSLYPHELQQRALVDQWLDFSAQHISHETRTIMFNLYFYKFKNVPADEQAIAAGYRRLADDLPRVEQHLAQHPYLAGQQITLADIAMLSALDTSEVACIDLSAYSHLRAWRADLMKQMFYQRCHESYTVVFNEAAKKWRATTIN